jgi:hypothetical protein
MWSVPSRSSEASTLLMIWSRFTRAPFPSRPGSHVIMSENPATLLAMTMSSRFTEVSLSHLQIESRDDGRG